MPTKTKLGLELRIHAPTGDAETVAFNQMPIGFGRGMDNPLVLEHPDVSRHHGEIYLADKQFFVRDLRSLNGIRLNGDVVMEAELVPGDRISVGGFDLEVLRITHETQSQDSSSKEIFVRPEGTGGVLEVIRAIDIQKVLSRPLTADDALPLDTVGQEEALEQYQKLSSAYGNLLQMMNFVSSLGSYSHLKQICEQFVAILRRVFPMVENVAVIEFMPGSSTEPKILLQDGTNQAIIASTSPSRTVLRRVTTEMRAVYAVDARRDPRFAVSDSVALRGVRSMMCAPLVARGEVLGAVYVENLSQPYCFGHFDLNLLTVFAYHLAVAMEVCRLLEERDKAFERAASSLQAAKKDKIALLLQYSQSEKKFRALFEQSALGAAVINLVTLRIEEVNDGLVRMLGYGRRQLTCMYYKELLAEESAGESEEWLLHMRRNGEGSFKTRLRTSTNEQLVALQSCRALRLGDNQVMVAYFIDVTAKERAEEETRRQLQRVMALSELSQALMTTLESDGIFALLFDKVRHVMPLEEFHVALRPHDDGPMRLVYSVRREANGNCSHNHETLEVNSYNGYVQRVLNLREPVLHESEDTDVPTRATRGAGNPFSAARPALLSSALFVPLASRKQIQGIICVQTARQRSYDHTHVETLQAMAAQTSLALSNARAFEAIRDQEESLRQLSLQIMTAQETERGRISRELHDGIGQQLTAMKYILESIRNSARSGTTDKLMDGIQEARDLATQIIQDLRNISLDLRPTMLDDFGLQPTLEWFVKQYRTRYDVEVALECDPRVTDIPQETATATYRIIQEALGNVAKHAQASSVGVRLALRDEKLEIDVRDDGVGFELAGLHQKQTSQGCSGVLNMKERAHFLGGEFRLETAPGKGTKLTLSIPIKEKC